MIEPGNLRGRRTLITGGATGIGRTAAMIMAARGAHLVINCKDDAQRDEGEKAVAEIRKAGGIAHCVAADVRHVAEIRSLFAQSLALLGGLDVVVSNAAGDAVIRTIAETSEEDYDRVMALNARGQFFVMQEAARRVNDGGRIIVLSSSTVATPYEGSASYGGAKRAAELYARTLAAELGDRHITVNVVAPGPTDTPVMRAQNSPERMARVIEMTPLGRLGVPEDIAEMIAFLASGDSRWVSRQIIQVGGGIA